MLTMYSCTFREDEHYQSLPEVYERRRCLPRIRHFVDAFLDSEMKTLHDSTEPRRRKLLRGILRLPGRASEWEGDVLRTSRLPWLRRRLERNCPRLLQHTFPQELEPCLACVLSHRAGHRSYAGFITS